VVGEARSRASAIARPQASQSPNVPASIRASAATTSASTRLRRGRVFARRGEFFAGALSGFIDLP
jgi:hypothetical protein